MNVSAVKTMNYEQITMNDANKNKPNSNPISSKAKMNVSAVKTMNYEQITMNDANKNKPNQSQFQTRHLLVNRRAMHGDNKTVVLDNEQ